MENHNQSIPIIKIKDLSVVLRKRRFIQQLLHDINLNAYSGEIVAIIGEKDSGKTTLAKSIFGEYNFINGWIKIDDKNIIHPKDTKSINKHRWIYKYGQIITDGPLSALNPSQTLREQFINNFIELNLYEKYLFSQIEPLKKRINKINEELNLLRNPYKKIQDELFHGLNRILQKERKNLYESYPENFVILTYRRNLRSAQNNFVQQEILYKEQKEDLILQLKFLSGNKRYFAHHLKEECKNTLKISKFFQKQEIIELEETINQEGKELNYKFISKEIKKFNKSFNNNFDKKSPVYLDVAEKTFFLFSNFSLSTLTQNISIVKENLENLSKILKEYDYQKFQDKINFLKDILDIDSAQNTISFINMKNYVKTRIGNFFDFLDEIIDDLSNHIEAQIARRKKITHKKLVDLMKEEIINLNYELFVYKSIKGELKKFKTDYKIQIYKHNYKNINTYYKFVNVATKNFTELFLEINSWKFNKKIHNAKEKIIINNEDFLSNQDKFFKLKYENEAGLKRMREKEQEINQKIQYLKDKISRNSREEIIKNFNFKEEKRINKKQINELNLEKEKILLQILAFRKQYGRKYREAFIDKKMQDLGVDLELNSETFSQYPKELSEIELYKSLLLKSLLISNKFLVMDQSFVDYNLEDQKNVFELYRKVLNKYDFTVLTMDDRFGALKKFVDHIYILHEGTILESGTKKQIFEHPIHPYTRMFLNAIKIVNSEDAKTSEEILLENLNKWNSKPMNEYKNIQNFMFESNHYVLATNEEMKKWTK